MNLCKLWKLQEVAIFLLKQYIQLIQHVNNEQKKTHQSQLIGNGDRIYRCLRAYSKKWVSRIYFVCGSSTFGMDNEKQNQ